MSRFDSSGLHDILLWVRKPSRSDINISPAAYPAVLFLYPCNANNLHDILSWSEGNTHKRRKYFAIYYTQSQIITFTISIVNNWIQKFL